MNSRLSPINNYVGTVEWFRDHLGYGFISCADFSQPIYVHYTRIVTNEQFKTLSKGQIVVFQCVQVVKKEGVKLMAINVKQQEIQKVVATPILSDSQ